MFTFTMIVAGPVQFVVHSVKLHKFTKLNEDEVF